MLQKDTKLLGHKNGPFIRAKQQLEITRCDGWTLPVHAAEYTTVE